MKKSMLRCYLAIVLPSLLFAQSPGFPPDWRIEVRRLLRADIPAGAPGGAVGIVWGDSVIYEDYAGLADLDTGRQIDGDTRFNIASNAKQFTALCVLQLEASGKLGLEDDVRKFVPELLPELESQLTLAHLLTHTSGLRDVYNLWSLKGITWWEEPLTNAEAIEVLAVQDDLNFLPGSQYGYSNSNYLLLTEVVSRVSGQPFADYAAQLFRDLGMRGTAFAADHTREIPNFARPYFNFDTWQTYALLTDLHGDGALFTTLPDQLRFERQLQDPSELSPDLRNLLTRSQELPESYPGTYGFGVEHRTYRGLPQRMHNGSTGAWKATFLRFPEQELSIVVANNSGKFFASDLARDIVDVLLGEQLAEVSGGLPPASLSPTSDVDITGVYGVTEGFALRIDRVGEDTFSLHRFNRSDIRLERVRPDVYREVSDTTFYQVFSRNADGESQITLHHPSHAPYSLSRLAGADVVTTAKRMSYVGTYRNAETGVSLVLGSAPEPQLVLRGDTLQTDAFSERAYVTVSYTFLLGKENGLPVVYLFDDRLKCVRFTLERGGDSE